MLESYQDTVNLKSHEEDGTKLKCTSLENKSVSRIVSASPFFCNNSLHKVATGDQNELSFKNKEDDIVVLDDHPVSLGEPIQISFMETSVKKRKTAHLFYVNDVFSVILIGIILLCSFTCD